MSSSPHRLTLIIILLLLSLCTLPDSTQGAPIKKPKKAAAPPPPKKTPQSSDSSGITFSQARLDQCNKKLADEQKALKLADKEYKTAVDEYNAKVEQYYHDLTIIKETQPYYPKDDIISPELRNNPTHRWPQIQAEAEQRKALLDGQQLPFFEKELQKKERTYIKSGKDVKVAELACAQIKLANPKLDNTEREVLEKEKNAVKGALLLAGESAGGDGEKGFLGSIWAYKWHALPAALFAGGVIAYMRKFGQAPPVTYGPNHVEKMMSHFSWLPPEPPKKSLIKQMSNYVWLLVVGTVLLAIIGFLVYVARSNNDDINNETPQQQTDTTDAAPATPDGQVNKKANKTTKKKPTKRRKRKRHR